MIYVLPTGEKVALEVELTNKAKDRIRGKIDKYICYLRFNGRSAKFYMEYFEIKL